MRKLEGFDFIVLDALIVALIVLAVLAFFSWTATMRTQARLWRRAHAYVPVATPSGERALAEHRSADTSTA